MPSSRRTKQLYTRRARALALSGIERLRNLVMHHDLESALELVSLIESLSSFNEGLDSNALVYRCSPRRSKRTGTTLIDRSNVASRWAL